jgi:hypothetical protein
MRFSLFISNTKALNTLLLNNNMVVENGDKNKTIG